MKYIGNSIFVVSGAINRYRREPMKSFSIVLIFLFAGMNSTVTYSQQTFGRRLFNSYDTYVMKEISTRRLRHADVLKTLAAFQRSFGDVMSIEEVGRSAEGRPIQLAILGRGPTKIFLWSQMHGDEPTATMGLLDALSYLSANRTAEEVTTILRETTLLILPMLNPDGAERFQRRTAQGIDMNRDAVQRQTPEAAILKAVHDRFDPEIGFNLHDQEPRFTAGQTGEVATIALLAPAFDFEKSDNAIRLRAKKITAEIAAILTSFIEGHISRYDDSFEPRAFGDNIQKWGTSTILIESGGWPGDPEKMFIRKLNCVVLLAIFHSIAVKSYEQADVALYERLPMNAKNLCDLIIEHVQLRYAGGLPATIVDIGINTDEVTENGAVKKVSKIVEVGDLSTLKSYTRMDAKNKSLDASLVVLDKIISVEDLLSALR